MKAIHYPTSPTPAHEIATDPSGVFAMTNLEQQLCLSHWLVRPPQERYSDRWSCTCPPFDGGWMTMRTTNRPSMSGKGHSWSSAWLAGIAALVAATPASAQHVLQGRVTDTTNAGLSGVEVVLAEARRGGVTDSNGQYVVRGIPTGRYEVVFRRLGYAPFVIFRSFMGDTGTTTVDVQLAAEAVVLPEVETKVRGPAEVPVKIRDWARRREYNVGGKFWDDSLLRTQDYRRLPEVLQGIPFVRIIRGQGGRYLATSKGGGRRRGVPRAPGVPAACYVEVYVDGARLSSVYTPVNLDDIPVHHILSMELYRSVAETPIEFQGPDAGCGVLEIWTQVGGNR